MTNHDQAIAWVGNLKLYFLLDSSYFLQVVGFVWGCRLDRTRNPIHFALFPCQNTEYANQSLFQWDPVLIHADLWHLCEGERQSSVGKLHGYPGRFGKVDFESCGSSHDNWRWVMTSDVFFIFLMCFVQAQVAHSEVRMSEVLSRPKAWQCQCARAAWCCMAFDVGTDGYLGETAKQRNSEMAVDFCGLPWTRHSELAWFFDVLCRLWSLRKR